MIPDLGAHAVAVLAAYGISAALVLGIVVLSLVQARRAKRRLDAEEGRRRA